MYSKLVRTLLVASVLAPIILTVSFTIFNNSGLTLEALAWLLGALWLIICTFGVLKYAPKELEHFSEKIEAIKNINAEGVIFILAYLLPLILNAENKINYSMTIYIAIVLLFVFWNSNTIFCNPILKLLGYHTYEITLANQVSALLLTNRTLRGVPKEKVHLVRLTEHVFIEKR